MDDVTEPAGRGPQPPRPAGPSRPAPGTRPTRPAAAPSAPRKRSKKGKGGSVGGGSRSASAPRPSADPAPHAAPLSPGAGLVTARKVYDLHKTLALRTGRDAFILTPEESHEVADRANEVLGSMGIEASGPLGMYLGIAWTVLTVYVTRLVKIAFEEPTQVVARPSPRPQAQQTQRAAATPPSNFQPLAQPSVSAASSPAAPAIFPADTPPMRQADALNLGTVVIDGRSYPLPAAAAVGLTSEEERAAGLDS